MWLVNLGKTQAPKALRVIGKILIDKYGKPDLRPPPEIPKIRERKSREVERGVEGEGEREMEELNKMRVHVRDIVAELVRNTTEINGRLLKVEATFKKQERLGKKLFVVFVAGWSVLLVLLYNRTSGRSGNFLVAFLTWFGSVPNKIKQKIVKKRH